MNRSIASVSIATVLVASFIPIQSFNFMELYHRYMLGSQLYQILQDRVKAGKCQALKNQPEVRKVVVENAYAAPLWVRVLNRVSLYEPLLDHAFSLYTVAENVLNIVEKRLKDTPAQFSSLSTDVRGNMDFVLIGRDESVTQDQIAGNIETVKNILALYKKEVLASQLSEEEETRLLNSIDVGLEHIKNAEPRLTGVERWHREKQIERFNNYVSQYCK